MPSCHTVEVVRTTGELAAYADQWRALAANALESNVFYEPGMLLPALENLVQPGAWAVCLAFHGHQLIAVFPLGRRRLAGINARGAFELLRYTHSFLHTPLLDRDYADLAVRAWLDWVGGRSGASIIAASRVTVEGPVFSLLRRCLAATGGSATETNRWSRPVLEPSGDGESYLRAALSGDRRRELQRLRRLLEKQGNLSVSRVGPNDNVESWISAFLELEASGWKGEGGTAMASTPGNQRFFRGAVSAMHRNGQAYLSGMRLDDRWIAMSSQFGAAKPTRGAFAFKSAFDETMRKFSPGVLLELDIVRLFNDELLHVGWVDSCTNPANELIGRLWQGRREIGDIMIMPAGWRGHLGRFALQAGLIARAARNWKRSRTARSLPAEIGRPADKSCSLPRTD